MPSGCSSTYAMKVEALSAISGPSSVCHHQTIILTNTGGGTWSSSAPTIASVGATTGVVTGNASGLNATITYTLGSGCKSTIVVTVNALGTISGTLSTCLGQTTTLVNSVSGGSWTSGVAGIAPVGSATGVVMGVAFGTSAISYIMPNGCTTSAVVSIGNLAPISGPSGVCVGQSVTLTNLFPGGTWTSNAPTIASIISTTGVVTGNAGNLTALISYTMGSGCRALMTITVNPLRPISGSVTSICAGQTTTLSDATPGGTWSSSAIGVATIGSITGLVTGEGTGTNIISYIMPTGCTATYAMNVNPLTAITGTGSVCRYSSITLGNATSGGTWSSSAPTIAAVVASTGVVTGLAPNLSATLTYSLVTGCKAIFVVSVNPIPAVSSIAGASVVSISGGTVTLTNPTLGGTWSSSNVAKASIGTTGIVTGVSVGSAIVTYTVTNAAGCANIAIKVITVGPTTPEEGKVSVAIDNVKLADRNIVLVPNPNGGEFILMGTLKTTDDVDLSIEILDFLGQIVYRGKADVKSGQVNEQVKLSNTLANGMYILNLHSVGEQYTFHFVMER